ncbi:MAG: helix-turn-helix transcriptional regulator [Chloroflexi bacterium]|nr:helix-turn-helix transcriptional regulator [Chloroflexota bacterium]
MDTLIDLPVLSTLVRTKRAELGYSVEELADVLGTNSKAVNDMESGVLRQPLYGVLRGLAGLGIPTLDLLYAVGIASSRQYEKLAGMELELPELEDESLTSAQIYAGLRTMLGQVVHQLTEQGRSKRSRRW